MHDFNDYNSQLIMQYFQSSNKVSSSIKQPLSWSHLATYYVQRFRRRSSNMEEERRHLYFFLFFKTYSKCQKLFHYELWFAAAPLIRLSGMTNLIHFYCPLPAIQMISVYRTTTGISHLKSFRKLIGWSSSTPLFLQTWLAIIWQQLFLARFEEYNSI